LRLFVALFPPEELRREIWKLGERVKGPWRREPPEKLHITIKFIGEVSEERASAIREALGAISMGAFEVELVGTGAFPSRKNPRVLWVGARSQGLVDLFGRVEEALQPLGIPREWRDSPPTSRWVEQGVPWTPQTFLQTHILVASWRGNSTL